jgi:hypothetical protein
MKKIITVAAFTIAALAGTKKASAQFAYNFTKQTQSYNSLTGYTSISNKSIWSADTTFTVPIGFTFKLGTVTTNKIYITAGNFISATTKTAKQTGFSMLGTGLADRGKDWMTSRSDVRYTTTGATGSRILKVEVFNAGFDDEYEMNGEMKDSISLQVWLFEGTNVVEFHYGSSMVSNFSDYFGPAMMSGFVKNIDTATGVFEKYYVVNGTASATSIDSIVSITQPKGLNSVPASGTVFRFTPKGNAPTAVDGIESAPLARVYPTQCTGAFTIEHNSSHPLEYMLVSAAGQVVAQGAAASGKSAVDISSLAPGAYTIRLADEATKTYMGQRLIKL